MERSTSAGEGAEEMTSDEEEITLRIKIPLSKSTNIHDVRFVEDNYVRVMRIQEHWKFFPAGWEPRILFGTGAMLFRRQAQFDWRSTYEQLNEDAIFIGDNWTRFDSIKETNDDFFKNATADTDNFVEVLSFYTVGQCCCKCLFWCNFLFKRCCFFRLWCCCKFLPWCKFLSKRCCFFRHICSLG